MQKLLHELKATMAFVERHFNLAKRYLGWEIVDLVYILVNGLTIVLIGVGGGPQQMLYLAAGALLWEFLSVLFHEVSESVSWERWEGTIEYTFMAPIHRATHLLGMCFYAVIYGSIRTIFVLGGMALFFKFDLSQANLFGALVVLFCSSISFIGLGFMAAVLPLMSPEKGSQATHIFQAIVLLVSGVYYEVSVLPRWLQPFSVISPATYTLRAARAALLDGASLGDLWPELRILLLIGIILIPLGLKVFGLGERYAMKTGKLKRNG